MAIDVVALLEQIKRPIKLPLEKALFNFEVPVSAIVVGMKDCNYVKGTLKQNNLLLDLPKTSPIVRGANKGELLILLNGTFSKLPQLDREYRLIEYKHKVGYEIWTAYQIIDLILPAHLERITSFEVIGHIAHLNLTLEHMPYASDIGQVILDKNPAISVVITKIGEIDHEFRFFDMKIIAARNSCNASFITSVSELNCKFTFDYSKVYWNSRLEHEHCRLVSLFQRDEIVFDMFAGVGPFSIPAAKRGCLVFANDLNPASVEYLTLNRRQNKISEKSLEIFNLDAGEFVDQLVLVRHLKPDHIIMNLPASSLTFLPKIVSLFRSSHKRTKLDSTDYHNDRKYPLIHCYLFARSSENPVQTILDTIGIPSFAEKPTLYKVAHPITMDIIKHCDGK